MNRGWHNESWRHALAARGIQTGQRRYLMAARFRVPQYQLAEIKRVLGDDVAQEAREKALREGLTAKQLAEEYDVDYVRGQGLAGQKVVERLKRGVLVSSDVPDIQKARLESAGRIAYGRERERLLEEMKGLEKQRRDELEELATLRRKASDFEFDQMARDAKVTLQVLKLKEAELARLDRKRENEGFVAFAPEPMRESAKRVPVGQSRIEEFGGPKAKSKQERITEYLVKKKAAGISERFTKNYRRVRIEEPGKFQMGSFRVIDPGRVGHTKLVIGKKRGERTTSVQAILYERKRG